MHLTCRILRRRGGLVALSLALAFTVAGTAASVARPSGRDWMHQYHRRPEPDRFVASVFEMSRTRYFALPGQAMTGIGFMATLFQQHPERVDEWLLYCRNLPEEECRMVVAALWYAGYPKGEEYLQLHARLAQDQRLRVLLDRILATSPSLDDLPIESKSALYLCWGRFLANGDTAVLERVLAALLRLDNVSPTDRWWLVSGIARHDAAVAWCRSERDGQSADVRESMEWVLRAAEALAAVD